MNNYNKLSKLSEWVLTNPNNYLLYKDIILKHLPDVYFKTNNKDMLDVITQNGVYVFALYQEYTDKYYSYIYNYSHQYRITNSLNCLNNLLDYSYIMSYIRDNKLNTLLDG